MNVKVILAMYQMKPASTPLDRSCAFVHLDTIIPIIPISQIAEVNLENVSHF